MKTKLWGSPYIPSAAVSTCKNGFMQEHFFFLISFGALKMKTHFSRSLWLKKRKKKKERRIYWYPQVFLLPLPPLQVVLMELAAPQHPAAGQL